MALNNLESRIFQDKKIILAVTGGIAAYKSLYICSELKKKGAEVFTILTSNALNFLAPLSFTVLSGNNAVVDTFENPEKINHISLPKNADAILIAPASANTISKIACGISDNLLTSAVCAAKCPVLIAPAMNENMWRNPILQENILKLKGYGNYFFSGPASGNLACGDSGEGRLEKEDIILEDLCNLLKKSSDLCGLKIMITAGATKEYIDNVRFISNYSSGKMGHALAQAAKFRGAERVVLVTASENLNKIPGIETFFVKSTQEMKDKVFESISDMDLIIMAAAVSDVVPEKTYEFKLKKSEGLLDKFRFKENENILRLLSEKKKKNQVLAGFAAESGERNDLAFEKIKDTNIDFIIANDISRQDIGFNSEYNEISIIERSGRIKKISKAKKRIIADEILSVLSAKLK